MAAWPKKSSLKEKLHALKLAYLRSIDHRIEQLRLLRSNLAESPSAESARSLFLEVHSLAGSGATFGFPTISSVAAECEKKLVLARQSSTASEREASLQLCLETSNSLIDELFRIQRLGIVNVPEHLPAEISRDPEQGSGDSGYIDEGYGESEGSRTPSSDVREQPASTSPSKFASIKKTSIISGVTENIGAPSECHIVSASERFVCLVDDDVAVTGEIETFLSDRGIKSQVFSNIDDAVEKLSLSTAIPPLLIATELDFPGQKNAGVELLKRVHNIFGSDIPMGFVSSSSDFSDRLQAVRAGSHFFFSKPLDLSQFFKLIPCLGAESSKSPFRILIVDDDPELAALYAEVLDAGGVESYFITDPTQVMSAISEFHPELVLLDLHMPACGGLEVAKIIRQASSGVGLPIIFLSAEQDFKWQMMAKNSGGADYLVKPISANKLYTAVLARVKAARHDNAFLASLEASVVMLEESKFRAQEIDRIQNQFILSMSHEIRSPLNGILGMAELLSDFELDNQAADYLKVLRNSGDTLLSVVDDLLDFSNIDSNSLILDDGIVSLDVLLMGVIETHKGQAASKGIGLSYELCSVGNGCDFEFVGDSIGLKQVIGDLVANGISHTKVGSVIISVSITPFSNCGSRYGSSGYFRGEEQTENSVSLKITVADTGKGLNLMQHKKLSAALSSTTLVGKSSFGSTGIRLSICHYLVSKMGGAISISDDFENGCSFEILLPVKEHITSTEDLILKGATVLLVSNDKPQQNKMNNWLPELGAVIENVFGVDQTKLRIQDSDKSQIDYLILDDPSGSIRSDFADVLEAVSSDRESPTEIILVTLAKRGERSSEPQAIWPLGEGQIHLPLCEDVGKLPRIFSRRNLFKVMARAKKRRDMRVDSGKPATGGRSEEQKNASEAPEVIADSGSVDALKLDTVQEVSESPELIGDIPNVEISSDTELMDALDPGSSSSSEFDVLVVDDQPINVLLATKFLEKMGLTSDTAVNGVEAVRKYRDGSYRLILMDCQMPIMDGLAATSEIRALEEKWRHIPIIALTAHSNDQARQDCERAGMDDFITKPIKYSLLESTVTSYLQSATEQSDSGIEKPTVDVYHSSVNSTKIIDDFTPRGDADSSDSVLDPSRLLGLQESIGEGCSGSFLSEVINAFVSMKPEYLGEINRYVDAKDYANLEFMAHKLKGASSNVGGVRLPRLCQKLESACQDGEYPIVGDLCRLIHEEFALLSQMLGEFSQEHLGKAG